MRDADLSIARTDEEAPPDDACGVLPKGASPWGGPAAALRAASMNDEGNEVGRRYDALYAALGDKNYELGAYQWQKIKEVIQAGYTRRF